MVSGKKTGFFILCMALRLSLMAQLAPFDKATLVELMEDRSPGATKFYQVVSNSSGKMAVAVPLAILVAGEIKSDKTIRQKARYIGESMAVSSLVTWAMKYSLKRERPFAQYPDEISKASSGGSPSFPSGHTSFAFSTATSLFIAFPKWYVGVPAFAWAGTVGYSRMYLGVHYPSDVIAGAIVGSGAAWLSYKANCWLQHHRYIKRQVTL